MYKNITLWFVQIKVLAADDRSWVIVRVTFFGLFGFGFGWGK